MTITNDLSRLANNANVIISTVSVNSTAITSVNVAGTLTVGSVVANGGLGTNGQALTTNGTHVYWSTIVGTNTDASYTWSNNHTFQSNVTIQGNLTVTGTTVTINATTLDVKDLNITIAKGAGSASAANGAGITVDSGYANLYYSSSSNTWTSTVGLNILSGNVGFGTATVGKHFEVVGELVSRASNAAGNNASSFQCDSSGTRIWLNSSYDPATYASGWSTALYLSNANGNIGIGGNTSPASKLTVTGVIESQAQAPCIAFTGDIDQAKWLMKLGAYRLSFLSDGASSGFDSMSYNSRTYYNQFYLAKDGGVSVYNKLGVGGLTSIVVPFQVKLGSNSNVGIFNSTYPAIGSFNDVFSAWNNFQVGPSTIFTADGKVGIGNSTPNETFTVAGSSTFGSQMFTGLGASTSDCTIEIGTYRTANGNAYIDFHSQSGSDYDARIIKGGSVNGVFVLSNRGNGNAAFGCEGSGNLKLFTNDTDRLTIDGNGNTGIGVTTPLAKLHVYKDMAYEPVGLAGMPPWKKRFIEIGGQGAANATYKVFTASRDPLNWGNYGPIEIIAKNDSFQGGSYSRWIFTHGYGVDPKIVCVESGGVSGNIPNLYIGSETTVNSNLKYTSVYCDVPYYRTFNIVVKHNYIEKTSIDGTTQIKFDDTYAANSSATMYGGGVTLAPAGGVVSINGVGLPSGMSGSFAVNNGNRPVSLDSSNGAMWVKGDTGGWGMGLYCVGSSNTNRGGFGWTGGADVLSYYWVGQAYNGTGVQLSYGGNSWATLSDARDKNVHGNIQNALDKIKTITSIYYNYKTDEEGTPRRVGFLAQEVQTVYPEAVTEIQREIENPTEETKRLSLSYTDMIPLLLEAIKELKEEFDKYKETHP